MGNYIVFLIGSGLGVLLGVSLALVACLTDLGFYRLEALRFLLRDLIGKQK